MIFRKRPFVILTSWIVKTRINCYSTNIFILFNTYRCSVLTNQKYYQQFSANSYQSLITFRGIKDYYAIQFVTKGNSSFFVCSERQSSLTEVFTGVISHKTKIINLAQDNLLCY